MDDIRIHGVRRFDRSVETQQRTVTELFTKHADFGQGKRKRMICKHPKIFDTHIQRRQ